MLINFYFILAKTQNLSINRNFSLLITEIETVYLYIFAEEFDNEIKITNLSGSYKFPQRLTQKYLRKYSTSLCINLLTSLDVILFLIFNYEISWMYHSYLITYFQSSFKIISCHLTANFTVNFESPQWSLFKLYKYIYTFPVYIFIYIKMARAIFPYR